MNNYFKLFRWCFGFNPSVLQCSCSCRIIVIFCWVLDMMYLWMCQSVLKEELLHIIGSADFWRNTCTLLPRLIKASLLHERWCRNTFFYTDKNKVVCTLGTRPQIIHFPVKCNTEDHWSIFSQGAARLLKSQKIKRIRDNRKGQKIKILFYVWRKYLTYLFVVTATFFLQTTETVLGVAPLPGSTTMSQSTESLGRAPLNDRPVFTVALHYKYISKYIIQLVQSVNFTHNYPYFLRKMSP